MATKKLSAKTFFADIKEEPDATRSTRPKTVSEGSVESPAGKEQKRKDAFRMDHARYLEEGAKETHADAKMGVGGFPKYPVSYEEAKDMHEKVEPLYREAAKDEIDRTSMGKVLKKRTQQAKENSDKADEFERNLHRFDRMDTKKNPTGWAKEFFRDLHDKK